jgi:hypothetical protein
MNKPINSLLGFFFLLIQSLKQSTNNLYVFLYIFNVVAVGLFLYLEAYEIKLEVYRTIKIRIVTYTLNFTQRPLSKQL